MRIEDKDELEQKRLRKERRYLRYTVMILAFSL